MRGDRHVPPVSRRGHLVLLLATLALAGCADAETSPAAQPDGLLALAGDGDGTALTGWGKSGGGTDIDLPDGTTTWISAGRAGVLVATLATGTNATSSPLHLDKTPKWRPVSAKDPAGKKPSGPASFATWDPQGGRYAILAGDLLSADPIGLVLVDPSTASAFEIALDRAVVAAPPAWIGSDRLVVVTGDAGAPRTTIVDTSTSELSDGPAGARLLATSVNGRRIADDGDAGRPGPRTRHGRLARRRRLVDRLDRAPERLHDRDRIRAGLDRSAARDRVGRGRRLGQPGRPRRPRQTGAASPNPDRREPARRRRRLAPLSGWQRYGDAPGSGGRRPPRREDRDLGLLGQHHAHDLLEGQQWTHDAQLSK